MATRLIDQLRAWRWQRQRLGPPAKNGGGAGGASAASLLADSGWSRSVGGSGPYLALFARGGLGRAAIDAAVAALEILELPSARGCTYVVPACDFALALRAGQGHGEAAELATAKKYLGVTDGEIEKLCGSVVDAIDRGPADPKELKDALGGAVRHLGDAGKKRGMTTTLPLALGLLQSRGEIRRVSVNGRIDQQRYRYTRWVDGPLARRALDDEEVTRELAERFFRWAGPATPAQLAWWAGLGQKPARAVAAELKLATFESDLLMFPDDLDALRATRPPKQPDAALVGSLDNLFHLRREVASLLDDDDSVLRLPGDQEPLSSVLDLAHHAIVAGGRLVGLWEYEVESRSIVYATFAPASAAVKRAVAATETFVREQLGDARSFSLDSPESRKAGIDKLRQLARS
jgi:hypothetical protein